MAPFYSPWGEIQHSKMLCPHVFSVDTASHGGIMVNARAARSVFSDAALQCAFREAGYYCFEEDCAATVALRELMDKGLFTAPVNDYWKPGAYEKCINDSVQRFYPEYWQARGKALTERGKAADLPVKKAKERER